MEESPLVDDSLYVYNVEEEVTLSRQGSTVAFVADTAGTETGPDAALWRGVQVFADTFGYTAPLYQAEEDSLAARESALRTAAQSGAAMVVCRGDELSLIHI